jgi:bifunctional NMN adenylyltransferase/nudix hydrolase
MGKPFSLGFIVGRFQHLHKGHEKMINTALATCDRVLLVVGSSQESGTIRNPFTLKTRMDVIRKVYHLDIHNEKLLLGHIDDMTNENDVCHEWGDFVLHKIDMWTQHYGLSYKVDCMVFGNDEGRMDWFRKEVADNVNQIIFGRNEYAISATKMRQHLVNGDYDSWRDDVSHVLDDYWYKRLQSELLEIPYYKELAGNA